MRPLTRHVAAGDAGLDAGGSLTAYYAKTGNPAGRWCGEGLATLGDGTRRLRSGDVVIEAAMAAVFRDGVDPLTNDALGPPYGRFDDGKRHASRVRPDLHGAEVGFSALGAGR